MAKCQNCGFDGLPEGSLVCTNCGANITQPIQETPSAPPAPPPEQILEEIPWKKREQIGFVDAFIKNITEIVTNPVGFFQKLKVDGDWGSLILWVVILAWITGFFNFIWVGIFHLPIFPGMDKFKSFGAFPMGFGFFSAFVMNFILAPLWTLIGLFIGTLLIHLTALLFGDGEKGFEMTAKAIGYAYTANLLTIIPFCGGIIGGIWSFVLLVLGLKYGHKTETWKAIMAPLVWVIIGIICCALGSALFFALLSRGFGS